jgi:hypothetical protein
MDGAPPTLRLHESLRGQLHVLAAGRTLEIGYFRSNRCGAVVGDLTVSWIAGPPGRNHIVLPTVEGVSVVADRRLLGVLGRAGPELRPGGWLSRGTPSIHLAFPELWLDFLDGRLAAGRSTADAVSPTLESTAPLR